ncbi:NAD(P)-binding protein [Hygrophoropsis aurantiaca]|uniref:NAD(P)-binding protein n=1 Tax=Hygrophoropsis aurantiaca TaxID=72124 RepID=A0ACB8AU25_9AGAM|nr:NAD(P)-binding protein [Hygrophoropsis aurantiaca]
MHTSNADFCLSNLFNVEGWVCVVTGGGTGIGLMIAQTFANNGAKVYITSRRKDVLEKTAQYWGSSLQHPHGQLIPLQCDITSKDSIQSLVQDVQKHEDHVDLLVNNAGVVGEYTCTDKIEGVENVSKELFDEGMAGWENVYRTNVIGYFFITTAFLPLLQAASARKRFSRTASVINVSSIAGITRDAQYHYSYNASKAAAIHLSTLLAQELRKPTIQVRVNNIAPGSFPSEMAEGSSDAANKSEIAAEYDYGEKKGIPAGRPGRDEDMAQAVLMLACNQYIYGQTLVVDGGYLLDHP